jgi:hypothetical protein
MTYKHLHGFSAGRKGENNYDDLLKSKRLRPSLIRAIFNCYDHKRYVVPVWVRLLAVLTEDLLVCHPLLKTIASTVYLVTTNLHTATSLVEKVEK